MKLKLPRFKRGQRGPNLGPLAKVCLIDHQGVEGDRAIDKETGLWELRPVKRTWVRFPIAVMQMANPNGHGVYKETPVKERVIALLACSLVPTVLGFGISFVALGNLYFEDPNIRISNAVVFGLLAGVLGLGVGVAIARQFKMRVMCVVGRLNGAPIWAVPPTIMTTDDEDAAELVEESVQNMWTRQGFKASVDGWETENFLKALGAARSREEIKWGARNGHVVGMDRTPPGQREEVT